MHKNNEDNLRYISLKQASKFSDYSQDYLSLRARHGKLKAIKIGRNWVTTKEWLNEYVNKVNEYKEKHNQDKDKYNDEENIDIKINNISPENYNNFNNKRPVLPHAIVAVAILVFILFSGGVAFGYYSNSILASLSPALNSVITSIGFGIDRVVEEITENQVLRNVSISIKYAFEYMDRYIEYLSKTEQWQYVFKNIKNINEKIIIGANITSNEILKTKFAKHIEETYEYVSQKAIVAINIISDKTLNNKLFAKIGIPDNIKSSISKNIKNLEKFTGEITSKIFYSIEKSYQSFILFCKNALSLEFEMSR